MMEKMETTEEMDILAGDKIPDDRQLDDTFVDSVIEIGVVADPEDDSFHHPETQEPETDALEFWEFTNTNDLPNRFVGKNETSVNKLTSGLLLTLLPEQDALLKQLSDMIHSQTVLVETLEHENSKFREIQIIKEVSGIMDRARIYHAKLVNIKKEMMSLHEKTNHLKRRALKLQQQKQREALHKEHQRDEELEKEKKLMAKVILRKT